MVHEPPRELPLHGSEPGGVSLPPGAGRAGGAPLPVFERLPSWTWLVSEENFNGDAGHGKSLLGVKVQRLDWSSPGREAESGVRA